MVQLADLTIELTGSKSKKVFKQLPSDDPKQRKPNIDKARDILGWTPKIELRAGLQRTIDYFDGLMREGDPLIAGR